MPLDSTKPNRSQTYGDAIDSARENDNSLKSLIDHTSLSITNANIPALQASKSDYELHKDNQDAHGNLAARVRITALELSNNLAKGSRLSLAERLDEGLLSNGSIKLSGVASKWITPGDVPTFVSATSFTVPTDRRLVFIAGANLRFTVSSQFVYGTVASSSFSAGVTTVQLDPAYPVLTAGLSALDLALIAFDNNMASAIASTQSQQVLITSAVDLLKREQITGFKNGLHSASEVLLRYVAARSFTLPINAVVSQFKSTIAATASKVFNIQKNGANIGTATFAAAGTSATFSVASATNFVTGDLLTLVAPAAPDATLANLAFNFVGVLT